MVIGLGTILVTGLFAGSVSCAAVQGVMLAGLVARQHLSPPPAVRAEVGRDGQSVSARRRSLQAQLGDDLAPVGGFLAGKVASHAVLGAVLGAIGGAVRFEPGVQGLFWLATGGLIVAFGLVQLRVPGFGWLVVEPPESWSRFVRGRSRSKSALAPTILGFSTVLVPCAVTLSVEAVALTSGSALAGAATMTVFVLGTGPLFVALGYASRRMAASRWRSGLAIATGIVVVAIGLLTVNEGLVLVHSPFAAEQVAKILSLGTHP